LEAQTIVQGFEQGHISPQQAQEALEMVQDKILA
jgi:hypothetical protein